MDRRNILLSVISPAHNEEDNILPLVEAFDNLRRKLRYGMELIIVDDGSTDKTAERARALRRKFDFLKVISYTANRGKTFAVQRGLDIAEGKYIVIFDADLQFDPDDIPPMVEKLEHGADLIAGYKVGKYQKPFVSRIYNLLGRILFRVPVRDMNAMKAMKKNVLETIPFRPDWHRYIVVWAHKNGFKIDEYPVKLRPRMRGVSKYRGIGRIFIGTFDMLSVWFQLTFAQRPMLFFGTAGIFTFALAFLIGIFALVLRYGYGIGFRPLLTLIAMLANIGMLLFIGGFLGEMIEGLRNRVEKVARTFQENTSSDDAGNSYQRREKKSKNMTKNRKRDRSGNRAKTTNNNSIKGKNRQNNRENVPAKNSGENFRQSAVEKPDIEPEKTDLTWGRKTRKGGKK